MSEMKKALSTATIIFVLLVSIVAGVQVIGVAKANPIPHEIPTDPPPISIQSSLNITYNQNDIHLNFTIAGISHRWALAYHLTDVYYECDEKLVHLNFSDRTNTEQFSANLTGLTKGIHALSVHAIGAGLYYVNYPNSTDMANYSIESTQTVSFTVDKDQEINNTLPSLSATVSPAPTSPSPSPSPIVASSSPPMFSPTITPSPSPSPYPTLQPTPALTKSVNPSLSRNTDDVQADSFAFIIILVGLAVVVIAVITIVNFKKRRKRRTWY
jgi:hypothetical protein